MDYPHGCGNRIIMNEFKFVCPSCGQKIKVDSAAGGRPCACPGCQTELLIPVAPKRVGEVPAATVVRPKKPASKAKISAGPGRAQSILAKTAKLPSTTAALPLARTITSVSVHSEGPPKSSAPRTSKKPNSNSAVGLVKAEAGEPLKAGSTTSPEAPLAAASSGSELPRGASLKVRLAAYKEKKPIVAKATVTIATEAAVAQERQTHVASLTPAIKLELVRSVRQRIANQAHWMPRITPAGKYAYAVREVDGKSEPIKVTSPEATRFSILGAALLELHLRKVTRTATGRAEFLDQELLDAIRQVAGNETGTQEAGSGESPSQGKQVPPISHAQSLQALDLLEEQYKRKIEESAVSSLRLEDLRITHLAHKIKLKVPIAVEEIYAALANELNEIHRRLTTLERLAGKSG